MPSFREAIYQANRKARDTDISGESIKLLMVELCQTSSTNLYLHYEDQMPEQLYEQFQDGVERLLKNEPLQYILGYQWFYGYKMIVNRDVLIPRYETEELVGNILADSDFYFADREIIETADIGTGSGAIAIALKKEEPKFRMHASDISAEAIEVARQNAELNNCEVDFMVGDMLQPLIDRNIRLDILISNPPYIPREQPMEKSVKDFEPHVALFGGSDGLFFYRRIFERAHEVIREKSFLAFEIGYDEKDALEAEVRHYFPEDRYEFLKDINGKNRMLFIYHNL